MDEQRRSGVSVVVQAGGQSRRMGHDKGLIPLSGVPMVAHVLARVSALGDELLLTTNRKARYQRFGVPLTSDSGPARGALTGLGTALSAATLPHVLVVACDLPFVEPALLRHMLSLRERADLVIPVWQQRMQPFCAVYARRRCLPLIERLLANGEQRVHAVYPHLNLYQVEPQAIEQFDPFGRSFFNVNTPADLATAVRLLQS